jgi:hypothetical protein
MSSEDESANDDAASDIDADDYLAPSARAINADADAAATSDTSEELDERGVVSASRFIPYLALFNQSKIRTPPKPIDATSILEVAFIQDEGVFGRSADVRRSHTRVELKKATGIATIAHKSTITNP